jgi:4-carboxymuconolactone decarboxylase
MSRIPAASRDGLSAQDETIWDRIAAVRTGMGGPYSMLMHVPALAERVAATEDYFRFHSMLADTDREIIILATARELSAHYPWTRHEIRARKAEIPDEVIEAIRAKAPLTGLSPRQSLLVEIVRALLRVHELPGELFDRAQSELGRKQLVEAIALIGHYSTIGFIVNSFDVEAPAGVKTF